MKFLNWLLIIVGTIAGIFTPWQHQVGIMAVMLIGYAACNDLKWVRIQALQGAVYGGLATGLGLQVVIAFGITNNFIPMVIAPLLLWLILGFIHYGVETKYSLQALPAQPNPSHFQYVKKLENSAHRSGHSAWSGDTSGRALLPDADGCHTQYQFYCSGEIAMGGPTHGEVIFSNACIFKGVGPSIALSDDARYAAMTLPSRNEWGLLIVDFLEKRAYQATGDSPFWEIDRISNGELIGRHSPNTSNEIHGRSISDVLAQSDVLIMVEDDGWWVIDYPGRQPLPQYGAVKLGSRAGLHHVLFVPDLKPFKRNPFLRESHPRYAVLVDDALLDIETEYPHAVWIDGEPGDSVQDGRFLIIENSIIDFKDAVEGVFSARNRVKLPLHACDPNTRVSFNELSDAGSAMMSAQFHVMPRSVSWTDAESGVSGTTYPWDEEDMDYWDIDETQQKQSRTRIRQHGQYRIDLAKYRRGGVLRQCTMIKLINRGNAQHRASLAPQMETHEAEMCAYTCTTSCGIEIENVLHEAIWSHCGRYLAIVHAEDPPNVPHRISMIDFATATVIALPGSYALPSFIWFDADMLELSHVTAVKESITVMPGTGRDRMLRVTDPEYASNPYELLIASLSRRRADAAIEADAMRSPGGQAWASVNQMAQHCIVFGPHFDRPVLQPPQTQLTI